MINLTFTSIILIYIVIMGFIGGSAAKYLRNSPTFREYATLSGTAGALLVGFGFFTAAFSASTWIGFPGNGYFIGLPFMLMIFIPASVTPYFLVGKRLAAVGKKHGVTTLAEYVGERYESRLIRGIYATLTFVFLIPYMAVQIQALGMAFQIFGGWPYWLACIVIAVVVVGYCAAGGMRAAVWTDIVQGILMFIISIFFPIVILANFGGLGGLLDKVQAIRPGALFPPGAPAAWATVPVLLSFVLMMTIGYCGTPFSSQKFLAAKNESAVYKGSIVTMISALVVNIFFQTITVLAVIVLFPSVTGIKADTLVYQTMQRYLPLLVSSIFIAGVAAASMSTVDSMMIMASTSIMRDLVQKVFRSKIPEERLVTYARYLTVVIGIIALLVALKPFALIFTMVFFTINIFAITGVPIVAGLYWKRATRQAAIISVVVGEIVLFIFSAFGPLAKFKGMIGSELLVGFIVTAVLMVGISLITPPSSNKVLAEYFPPYDLEREVKGIEGRINSSTPTLNV